MSALRSGGRSTAMPIQKTSKGMGGGMYHQGEPKRIEKIGRLVTSSPPGRLYGQKQSRKYLGRSPTQELKTKRSALGTAGTPKATLKARQEQQLPSSTGLSGGGRFGKKRKRGDWTPEAKAGAAINLQIGQPASSALLAGPPALQGAKLRKLAKKSLCHLAQPK